MPPTDRPDPWQVLRLNPGADPRTIRSAYRALVRSVHPDRNPHDPDAAGKLAAATAAYRALCGQPAATPTVLLRVSLREAVHGCTRRIRVGGRERSVRIPPGAANATRLNLPECRIIVTVETHPLFHLAPDGLRVDARINAETACRGGHADVPTLNGEPVRVSVPAGTRNGDLLRLNVGLPQGIHMIIRLVVTC